MRFSCEKALLQAAINTASRAVSAKSSIPALEGLLLQAGTALTVSGYNMQTGIRTKVAADVTEEGELVVNARLFGDIIRRMGDDVVSGRFTGTDITETRMTGFTIPVTATYRAGARWTFNLGPYVSYWIYRDFDGEVFDGYLREGSPVGQKITIGADNPASYDFSENMRRFSWGMEFAADFRVREHLNVFGLLDWGLNDVFASDFETVTFSLYPIYATLGLAYYY